jgi:hypothetical protein
MNRIRDALSLPRLLGAVAIISVGVAAAYSRSGGDDPSAQSAWADVTPVESSPLVVALCHGANQTWPAKLGASYFEAQFSETSGSVTIADYWRDISNGRFSIEGSIVVDVQLDVPRDEIGDRDDDDWVQCRDGLDAQYDIDWDRYSGPVVFKPQTLGRTIDAVGESDTEIRVRTEGHSVAADWPTPPFTAVLTTTGSLWPSGNTVFENVQVTAVSVAGDDVATFTVQRGHTGGYRDRASSPTAFAENTLILDVSEIVGSAGRLSISAQQPPGVINHELGHFFGWNHSRKLSTASSDYGDCFDIMSATSCRKTHYFTMSADYAGRDAELVHGLGMTSIYLDREGWIDEEDREVFSCGAATYQLRALGLRGSGLRQLRVPVSEAITGEIESEYLTVELRSQRFAWDRGIPSDAVVLHLRGDDGFAYLVDDDEAGGTAGMVAGDRYEINGWILRVDDIDAGEGTAEVTLTAPEPRTECALFGGSTAETPTTTTEPSTTEAPTTTTEPSTTTTGPDLVQGAACIAGSWLLNSQVFVDTLAAASGAPGGIRHGGGDYTITISEDGVYRAVRDGWALRMETPEGAAELVFDSDEAGTMTWDDAGRLTFAETDSTSVTDLTVKVEVDGQMLPFPMSALPAPFLAQMPTPELMSGSGSYTCVGDLLELIADDSGVPATWTRTG